VNYVHTAKQQKISNIFPLFQINSFHTRIWRIYEMKRQVYHLLLEGSSRNVGRTLGRICRSIPGFRESVRTGEPCLSKQELPQMLKMFDEFCPGLNEEIEGFAEELKIPAAEVFYYAMTYLRPGCSQMAVLPSKTENGHTLLARN
jgi:predicted choloylglycine hydrolase